MTFQKQFQVSIPPYLSVVVLEWEEAEESFPLIKDDAICELNTLHLLAAPVSTITPNNILYKSSLTDSGTASLLYCSASECPDTITTFSMLECFASPLAQKVKLLEHHLQLSAQPVPLIQPYYRETYPMGKWQ